MEALYTLYNRLPVLIQTENDSEFNSKILDKCAYENDVRMEFSYRGKPTDIPFIKLFKTDSRTTTLKITGFVTGRCAGHTKNWRREYN